MIVGLTSAGRVSQTLRIPSLVIATAAIRDEGHVLPLPAAVKISSSAAQLRGAAGDTG
jgi:hypothetical protein